VSPNTAFPPDGKPDNAITERVLAHPRVIFDVDGESLVLAIRDELLVRASARPQLEKELQRISVLSGSLRGRRDAQLPDDVEVWRLTSPETNSIDEARRLRRLVRKEAAASRKGPDPILPPISPNHVLVVSKFNICPAGPPHPVPPPHDADCFVEPCEEGPRARVVVIDTGYIEATPPHAALDARVTSIPGEWFDTSSTPGVWRADPPDVADADGNGRLDGVAGHGTFIAGIVAHQCRQAEITVVGQRHECLPLGDEADPVDRAMLFTSEIAVANALLTHADADVVSCGFAFPTLDGEASIPFTAVMQVLTGPNAPRPGVAVVAPAGNEDTARAHWPAAHPDVIGVAATNRRGTRRVHFSNWGPWADCCARGQDVQSTFIEWDGPVEGDPPSDIERFCGWARWDGTSFSTPKVAAAIARLVAASGGAMTPVEAFEQLVAGAGGVTVTPLTDVGLSPFPGVTLPHLHLG
jgi:hypothetical protein